MNRCFRMQIGAIKYCYSLLILSLLVTVLSAQPPKSFQPHFEARDHQSDYHGPGRDEPEPQSLKEIRLGYFGPSDPLNPDFGPIWSAAELAVNEANLEGGYRGLPFRLIPIWTENQWGSGISQLARSIYTDELWAIIGSIDGPSTHLVEQLVAKARLTLINPASCDKTVNLANVPWMFSCLPGEHLQAPVLAEAIAESTRFGPLTLVSATDHDSRVFVKELKNHLARTGTKLTHHFEMDSRQARPTGLVEQVIDAQTEVVAVVAGASESARLVRDLRESRFQGQIYGGPNMGRTEFFREAGTGAVGVTFPLLVSIHDADPFLENFQAQFGTFPDFRVLQTYDAVVLLIAAIRRAGLNRVLIRDAIRDLSPWQGISGPLVWDALGQNRRPVELLTIANSHVKPSQHR